MIKNTSIHHPQQFLFFYFLAVARERTTHILITKAPFTFTCRPCAAELPANATSPVASSTGPVTSHRSSSTNFPYYCREFDNYLETELYSHHLMLVTVEAQGWAEKRGRSREALFACNTAWFKGSSRKNDENVHNPPSPPQSHCSRSTPNTTPVKFLRLSSSLHACLPPPDFSSMKKHCPFQTGNTREPSSSVWGKRTQVR